MNLFEDINLEEGFEINTNTFISNHPTETPKDNEGKKEEKVDEDLIEINDEPIATEEEEDLDNIIKDVIQGKQKKDIKENVEDGTEKPPTDNKQHDSSPIKLFAKVLLEEGVISELDEESFDKTDDKIEILINSIKNEVVKAVESVEENYPPKLKQVLNAYKNGVPEDEIFNYIQDEIEYSSITENQLESNEELQKALIKQDLLNRNFTEEEIEEQILDAETLDKLLIKSKVALKSLTKQQEKILENKVKEKQDRIREQQEKIVEQQNKVREYLDSTKELMPGVEINKNVKDKIFNSMYKPAGKDSQGNPISSLTLARSKDPVKFDTIFHYLLVNGVFEGKMDALVKPVKTNAVKDFEKVVNSNTSFKEGNQKVVKTSDNNSTISALKSMFNV